MGYYIETNKSKGKAEWLVENAEARIVSLPEAISAFAKGEGVVCVIDNGPFEAAGYCFSENEFAVFAYPDGRPRKWVVMNKSRAEELSGYRRRNVHQL